MASQVPAPGPTTDRTQSLLCASQMYSRRRTKPDEKAVAARKNILS